MMPRRLPRAAVPLGVLAILCGCSRVRDPPTAQREPAGLAAPALVAPLDSEITQGQRLYDRGEYAAARALWLGVLERARLEQNATAEAQLLTGIGLAAWRLGEHTEARRSVEAAVALEGRHGLAELLPRSYNALGLLAWDQGHLSDAVRLYQQTMAAATAVGNREYVYKAAANLGTVYSQLGDFPLARQYLLRALDGARSGDDLRTAGRVLNNLAMLETLVGSPLAALRWLQEARAVVRVAGDATGEEAIMGQLASAYLALGEPGRAFAAADSALRQARAQGLRQAEAANLELQAQLYRETGNLARALELYRRASAINEELGLAEEAGRDLRNEAEIHLALGNVGPAARLADRALQIHRDIGTRPAELADRFLLAQLAEARGERRSAEEHLAAARTLVRIQNVRSVRVDAALAEARVWDRRGDARQVVRVLDAIADDLVLSGYSVEWEVRALRARAHARLDEVERAAAEGRRGVAAVERVRGNFGSGLLRTGYVTDKRTAYTDLVGVLLRLGRMAEAFEVADAARGRALLEHVGGGTAGPLGMLAEREDALRRIEQLASGIAEAEEAGDAGVAEDLVPRLRAARRDFEASLVTAAEQAGAGVAVLGIDRPGVGAVQQALEPGEALLEYLVSDDRLFTFVVTAKLVRGFETPIAGADLQSRVRLARDLLADAHTRTEQASAVLAALHGTLLGNAKRLGVLDGVRRLIVVAHGALAYVPFAALRDEDTRRYLVERYSLVYLPSAGALPVLRAAAPAQETPEERGASAAAVFAPLPGELPGSSEEARAVHAVLRRAEVTVGKRATELAVRRALARPTLVHVASHGVMNAASPMFSRVELAVGRGASADDDGRLEVHEVLGLTIRSPLVFLSGCETGLGAGWATAFMQGEDYATLDRAFLYAGARNVVATLWPVPDRGAAVFAEAFYRRLSASGPIDAMAQAQRAMLANPRYRHPYYWAGYRLAGGGGPTVPPQEASVPSVSQ